MPRYWLTAHWPPLATDAHDILNVYVQDQFKDVVEGMAVGDRLLVYELSSGPAGERVVDGKPKRIRRRPGAQAIVCDARVATPVHERANYRPETFVGRGVKDFRWTATTDDRRQLSVPLLEVNRIFGWEAGHVFRGFNGGRGIKEITEEEYRKVAAYRNPGGHGA